MLTSTYDYYFFYYNRKKIRDSFFLDIFPKFVKDTILRHYTVTKYQLIDKYIIFSKIIFVSLFYFVIYKATYVTNEVATYLPYITLGFLTFFVILILLGFNKQTIPDIEHNHYYRMLGDSRNELIKKVIYKRTIYTFTNWLIPLTLFPFLYASFIISYEYILLYFLLITILFYVLNTFVFLSQRLFFDYLQKIVILDTFALFFLMAVVTSITLILSFLPTVLLSNITNLNVEILVNIIIYTLILFGLHKLNSKAIDSALNYSITNTIILHRKSRAKRNQIQDPNLFVKLFHGKDNFTNKMISKDFITHYRKDKRELFALIIFAVSTIIYSLFIGGSLHKSEIDILMTLPIDLIINAIISFLFINYLYKLRDVTWYSSEGRNILMYSRLGYDKHQILNAKQKVNYILNGIYLVFYMIVPIFFIFTTNIQGVIYLFLRVIVLYLFYTNIIDYFLIEDAKNPRVYKHDPMSGMGKFNMLTLIGMATIVFTYLSFKGMSDTSLLALVPNLGFILMGIMLFILIVIKAVNIFKQQKFKGVFEGGNIHG